MTQTFLTFKSSNNPSIQYSYGFDNEDDVHISVRKDGRGHEAVLPRKEFVRLLKWQLASLEVDELESVLNFIIGLQVSEQAERMAEKIAAERYQ